MSKPSPTPRCDQEGLPVAAVLAIGSPDGQEFPEGPAERAAQIASVCISAWLKLAREPVGLASSNESFQRVFARRAAVAQELSRLIAELGQESVQTLAAPFAIERGSGIVAPAIR